MVDSMMAGVVAILGILRQQNFLSNFVGLWLHIKFDGENR